MTYVRPARPRPRQVRIRRLIAGLLLGIAAIVVAVGYVSTASPSPTVSSPATGSVPRSASVPRTTPPPSPAASSNEGLRSDERGALGEADGAVPNGTTVFDGGVPGVANLDPALLGALRRAATAAADDGVEFLVDSGWRSAAYQEKLLDQAVVKYGSKAAAARWVATPATSAHVSGDAIDLGPAAATGWLSEHGAAYGLCQIYRNEAWHYELRPEAVAHGCPAMYADPTQDPRMQHA